MTGRSAWLLALVVVALLTAALDADARRRKRRRRSRRPPAARIVKPAAPTFTVERLADGLTLVHLPGSGDEVFVRVGVRGGSLHDPADKSGVAWLVSRLVFDGSYDVKEGELPVRTRELGGRLDVEVGPTWTQFALDAPAGAFEELFEKQLLLVTNPMLQFADLDRARAAAVNASSDDETVLGFALDQLAFPGDNLGRTHTGTKKTRASIDVADVLDFYARYYVPSNAVVVVAGAVELDVARRVIERAVRWPPVRQPDWQLIGGDPNVPAEAKRRADKSATALGYHLGPVDPGTCDAVARVVEARALAAVRWTDLLVTDLSVHCVDARGHPFLAAFATGRTDSGGQLPTQLARAVERQAGRPLRRAERALVKTRKASELALLQADPARLATIVGRRALTATQGVREHVAAYWESPALPKKRLQKLMREALVPERRVTVTLSPFEG